MQVGILIGVAVMLAMCAYHANEARKLLKLERRPIGLLIYRIGFALLGLVVVTTVLLTKNGGFS